MSVCVLPVERLVDHDIVRLTSDTRAQYPSCQGYPRPFSSIAIHSELDCIKDDEGIEESIGILSLV